MGDHRAIGVTIHALVVAVALPAAAQTTPDATTSVEPVVSSVVYGAALRARWVSVPGWLLSTFMEKNVPLSSYGLGVELFRRKGDRDVVLAVGYQNMSPPDGNWLARGHDASQDTDLVQFRGLALVGADVSVIGRGSFGRYFGYHYGGGLGIGLVTGKVLRVSDYGCTAGNAGDTQACRPIYCPASGCTEALHVMHQGGVDNGPTDPHRYQDPNVPGAVPIIDIVGGLDFHVPRTKDLELRLEGGFYDAFFLGLASAYLF